MTPGSRKCIPLQTPSPGCLADSECASWLLWNARPMNRRGQEYSHICATFRQMLLTHGDTIKTHFLPTRLETSCSNTNPKRVWAFKFWVPFNVLPTKPHLVYPQQKRDAKRPKHFFVEMCHCDQHLIFLINVYLVQRYFLGTHFKHRSVKHSIQTKGHILLPTAPSMMKLGRILIKMPCLSPVKMVRGQSQITAKF